jgi:hypothetical protein
MDSTSYSGVDAVVETLKYEDKSVAEEWIALFKEVNISLHVHHAVEVSEQLTPTVTPIFLKCKTTLYVSWWQLIV